MSMNILSHWSFYDDGLNFLFREFMKGTTEMSNDIDEPNQWRTSVVKVLDSHIHRSKIELFARLMEGDGFEVMFTYYETGFMARRGPLKALEIKYHFDFKIQIREE